MVPGRPISCSQRRNHASSACTAPEGGRALAAGHSPTNEAAVLGVTGELVAPISKGAGVLVVVEGDRAHVDPLS